MERIYTLKHYKGMGHASFSISVLKKIYYLFAFVLIFQVTENDCFATEFSDTSNKVFTNVIQLKTTPVKNQYKSNTCWAFSTLAMFETELLKENKGEFDLSEMFVIYYTYIEKAEKFVRLHGSCHLVSGGSLVDPLRIIDNYGIVPEEAYSGLIDGHSRHDHIAMDAELHNYLETVAQSKKVPPKWKDKFIKILDKYLGTPPETFTFNGKTYTPVSFAAYLGLNTKSYQFFSSFCNKPYYSKQLVEVPDNWSWDAAINIPLKDYELIIDNSLKNGYSVAIAADVSERGFQWKWGIAQTGTDPDNNLEIDEPSMEPPPVDTFFAKSPELAINPLMRQQAFDSFETTDDHGMLIVGIARDENKNKYYIVKNSWGATNNQFKGYVYLSESYLLYKSLTILVNSKGIQTDILQNLNAEKMNGEKQ